MSRTRAEVGTYPARDRSLVALLWYTIVQHVSLAYLSITGGIRATGRRHVPESGPVLLVSNHASFWDVFVLAVVLRRPLNYVARSTLFKPVVGAFLRSLGAFPIQRESMGTQGFKETLKRLKLGAIVALFPEGTRSWDGELGALKDGMGTLCTRSRAPIVPAGIVGAYESWPRTRRFPRPYPIRVHFGEPIPAEELDGRTAREASDLIRSRMVEAIDRAREGLEGDLGRRDQRRRG